MGTNTYEVDEEFKALCCVCKRKFSALELESCCYCGRFVCKAHRTKSKRAPGGYVCRTCKNEGAE